MSRNKSVAPTQPVNQPQPNKREDQVCDADAN